MPKKKRVERPGARAGVQAGAVPRTMRNIRGEAVPTDESVQNNMARCMALNIFSEQQRAEEAAAGGAGTDIPIDMRCVPDQRAPQEAGAGMNVRVGSNDGPSDTEHGPRTSRTHLPHHAFRRDPPAQAAESGAEAGAAVRESQQGESGDDLCAILRDPTRNVSLSWDDFLPQLTFITAETALPGHKYVQQYNLKDHKQGTELQKLLLQHLKRRDQTMQEYLIWLWERNILQENPRDPDDAMMLRFFKNTEKPPFLLRLNMTTELRATKNLHELQHKYKQALQAQCNAADNISELQQELDSLKCATSETIRKLNSNLAESEDFLSQSNEKLLTRNWEVFSTRLLLNSELFQHKQRLSLWKCGIRSKLHEKELALSQRQVDIDNLKSKNRTLLNCMQELGTISNTEQVNEVRDELTETKQALAHASLAVSALTVVVHRQNGSIEAAQQAAECVICLSNAMTTALTPCGHRVVCSTCAIDLQQCPLCRSEVNGTIRVYV